MKNNCTIILFFLVSITFAQNISNFKNFPKFEDLNGNIITDSLKIKNRDAEMLANNGVSHKATLNPVHLCSNSNFEQFESLSGANFLKNFLYTVAGPSNPTQCATPRALANQQIKQFDPSQSNLMVSTVNANFIDPFIRDINAFDQFALKINYQSSSSTSGVVQAKRFKTNNETSVIFNYKVVLQSIVADGHENEQPFFKARIINKVGAIVSEFCVVGDPSNCIFKTAPNFQAGSVVLFTPNWQAGNLDISGIPNNEEFIVEFTAARCGLGGHFGYAYIDDLCLNRSNENSQGSIELNPQFKICPQFPINVCGNFTVPNSGGISATVESITLNVYNNLNNIVFTSSTPVSLDLVNKTFCFNLTAANFPVTANANYNIGAKINYSIVQTNCAGTSFNTASDNDANVGWDISFLNCQADCDVTVQTGILKACDGNADGKEFFNLPLVNTQLIGLQTGLTISYFNNYDDAFAATNTIVNFVNFESYSNTVFARISKNATCFKIIAFQLFVKNPSATISGILNVCNGSTVLTASPGVSYIWSNGATTRNATVATTGTYSVVVTDIDGCVSNASVTILPSTVAVSPTIVVSQPTCFVSTGTITITSAAASYSYDDGVTWTTSSQATNLGVGTYLVKIRTVNNCESYSSPIQIRPFLTIYPAFTFVNTTSCNGLGSITITTIATEYSFDDGLTWSTNNTANNLPLGIYKIRTKNEFGCISDFNSVTFQTDFLPILTYTTIQPNCGNLGSIIITSPAAQYSFDGGATWQLSNTLSNLNFGGYFLKIKNAQGCTSPNLYFLLQNFENTYPSYTIDPAGCNKYASVKITTLADLYSFDGGLTWSTNNTISNLPGAQSLQLVAQIGSSCNTQIESIYLIEKFLPLPIVNNFTTLICDNQNNGNENVNLSSYNSIFVTNATNYQFSYFTTQQGAINMTSSTKINNFTSYNLDVTNKIIYVVVKDNFGCSSIAELDLTLIKTPEPSLKDIYYLCEGFIVNLVESKPFATYNWSTNETTSSITVSQPGTYTLTVTENNGTIVCSTTKKVQVILSNPAVIIKLDTQDWTEQNNTILINVNGLGNYEYSLNNLDYQDSNIFDGLSLGAYTVYVRDKNGCGLISGNINLLMYPKFFTPNNDGLNDFWKIKFSEKEPNLKFNIFDKFGKLLAAIEPNSAGWNGTYNGREVPADDYWFVVTRENGKELKGHFALKR